MSLLDVDGVTWSTASPDPVRAFVVRWRAGPLVLSEQIAFGLHALSHDDSA